MHRRFIAGLLTVAALAAGIALRIAAARHELWLDEIWSMELMQQMRGPLDVFTLHHDNNHYLNTLWLWLLGTDKPYWMYRIPSLASGIALMILVTAYVRKKDPDAGMAIAILLSISPLFMKASADARGYAPMLLCAWLSFRAMERYLDTRTIRDGVLFGVLAVLAFLFQLTYAFLFAGLLAWSMYEFWHRKKTADVWIHLLPIATLFILMQADIAQWTVGGGPRMGILPWITQFPEALLGIPAGAPVPALCAAGVAVLLVISVILRLQKSDPGKALFLTVTLFAAPGIVVLALRPQYISPRYFLTLYCTLFIMAALAAGRRLRGTRTERITCILLLAAFTAGNAASLYSTVTYGNGGYIRAVEYMLQEPGPVHVGGNTGIRIEKPLRLYAHRLSPERTVIFTDDDAPSAEWLLLEKRSLTAAVPAREVRNGTDFDLVPDVSGKGQFWSLYRRRAPAGLPLQ